MHFIKSVIAQIFKLKKNSKSNSHYSKKVNKTTKNSLFT